MKYKRVLITGGTSGIGLATSLKFAGEGDRVVISGRNEEVGRRLERDNKNIFFVKADLSKKDEIDYLVDEAYNRLGGIDILVNNAGVLILKRLEDMELDEFIYTYKVNLYAPFYLMKRVMPRMAEEGGGVVINISSIAGLSSYPNGSAYCSSKAALISLSKALALEYASRKVRVVVVAPGLVKTRMAIESLGSIEAVDKSAKNIPLGFVAEPEDIAELIYYLSSDKARYVTGSVYVIDGGVIAGRYKSLVEED